jgi:hypothetical protein
MAKRKRAEAASADAYVHPDMKCTGNNSTFTCRVGGCGRSFSGCSRTVGPAYTQHLATMHATDVGGVRTLGKLEFDNVGKRGNPIHKLRRIEIDDASVESNGDVWCGLCGWRAQNDCTIETRKEYVRRHYALHHAPIVALDEELYDGAQIVGTMGGAYLVRTGDEERAVLACHCGAVGDTNNVMMKPLCVAHGGLRVYYAGAGWMNLGAPSNTPWFLAFRAMEGKTYANVEYVTAAAKVVDTRAIVDSRDGKQTERGFLPVGTALRLQLDDVAWSARSCAHSDNGVCGAPVTMGG